MNIPSMLIDAVVNEARKVPINELVGNFRLGALIFNRTRIISKGYNRRITIDRVDRFITSEYIKWPSDTHTSENIISIHAEMMALMKGNGDDICGANIIVVRLNKHDEFRNARPCNNCMAHLKLAGIKTVIYSIAKYPYFIKERI